MSRLRVVVLCTAVVQIVVALVWFGLIAPNPRPQRGTVINLIGLLLAGGLGLVAQRTGTMRFSTVGLNWLLVVLWTWGLVAALGRVQNTPELAGAEPTIIVTTLAIIIPCMVNGTAVALLPRRGRRQRGSPAAAEETWNWVEE